MRGGATAAPARVRVRWVRGGRGGRVQQQQGRMGMSSDAQRAAARKREREREAARRSPTGRAAGPTSVCALWAREAAPRAQRRRFLHSNDRFLARNRYITRALGARTAHRKLEPPPPQRAPAPPPRKRMLQESDAPRPPWMLLQRQPCGENARPLAPPKRRLCTRALRPPPRPTALHEARGAGEGPARARGAPLTFWRSECRRSRLFCPDTRVARRTGSKTTLAYLGSCPTCPCSCWTPGRSTNPVFHGRYGGEKGEGAGLAQWRRSAVATAAAASQWRAAAPQKARGCRAALHINCTATVSHRVVVQYVRDGGVQRHDGVRVEALHLAGGTESTLGHVGPLVRQVDGRRTCGEVVVRAVRLVVDRAICVCVGGGGGRSLLSELRTSGREAAPLAWPPAA